MPLYVAEVWGLTKELEDLLIKCDRKMLRCIAGITWKDRPSNATVAKKCGDK